MTTPTFEYWIDIGRTNGQYTLHRELRRDITTQQNREYFGVQSYTYIRNVGRVYEEAVQRADKYIDELHTAEYGFAACKMYDASEGGELRHPGQYDDDKLWFGKYYNADIADVVTNDPDYLIYLRDNFGRNGNARMTSLLNAIDAMDLGESKQERARREELERREAEQAEYDARKQPIPTELAEGRSTFTGTIIAIYQRETEYGIQDKMIFEDDRGFKLSGTAPRALWKDDDRNPKGSSITFDAAVVISDDDACFGFAKRPTKIAFTNEVRT